MKMKVFQHQYRVSYADSAPGDHVYFSRYLEMIEECRGEFFRGLGISLKRLADELEVQFPVRECHLTYRAPARHDDVLTITAVVEDLSRARMTLAYEIFRGDELLVTATIKHACVGGAGRPKRMPEEVSATLSESL